MPPENTGGRTLRLCDVASYEVISVRCLCGRLTEYGASALQRIYRLAASTPVRDLLSHLRCPQCNRKKGFRISVIDTRSVGLGVQPHAERVIVEQGT
jgi:hypothetical protein